MDWEYLHLLSHSFPIVLSISGAAVGLAGWTAGRTDLERWGILALLVGGAFTVPAYITGLVAADVAGSRTFVEPGAVQSHRIAATWASVPLLLAGSLAAFSLFDPEDPRLRRFVLVVGVVASLVTAWAAYLGSRIEHGPAAGEEAAAAATLRAPTAAIPRAPPP